MFYRLLLKTIKNAVGIVSTQLLDYLSLKVSYTVGIVVRPNISVDIKWLVNVIKHE